MTLKKYANMEVHGVSEILKNFVEFRRVLVGNSTFSTTDGSLGPEGFFLLNSMAGCQLSNVVDPIDVSTVEFEAIFCFFAKNPSVIYLITSFQHCSHPRCCGMRCAEEISPSKQLVLS